MPRLSIVDAYASQPQYVAHIAPIWQALPAERRGVFLVAGSAQKAAAGLPNVTTSRSRVGGNDVPVIVAGFVDERTMRRRPAILVEHGAGQSYSDHSPGYPGGRRRESVVMFLCPSWRIADRWRDMYPDSQIVVVGCPKLDRWLAPDGDGRLARRNRPWATTRPPVVGISFHWPCMINPECGSAFDYWRPQLRTLARLIAESGVELVAHSHPRITHEHRRFWTSLGVRFEPSWETLADEIDVYVCDNSSTIFEAAAIGIPVVVLDSPAYRTDVHHGLRFWTHADIGQRLHADHPADPAELLTAIHTALDTPAPPSEVVADVYDILDGSSTARAVHAIVELLDHPLPPRRTPMASHDPFRASGPRRAHTPPAVDPEDLRVQIVGWHILHAITPSIEQREAFATMSTDELAETLATLRALSADEIAALKGDRLDDIEGDDATGLPPDGTVADVNAWIGDDPARARVAIAHEQAGRARVGILRYAADVVADTDGGA